MSCAKTAEPIEMLFVMVSLVDPRNHVIDWGGGADASWKWENLLELVVPTQEGFAMLS